MTSMMGPARNDRGFNAIELMVVVVIVGILTAIAVPLYMKYAYNSRITEATSRMGELLEAAKLFATSHESNANPSDADWPTSCTDDGFLGNCESSDNFTYGVTGTRNGTLFILATGKPGTRMANTKITLEITNPLSTTKIVIANG